MMFSNKPINKINFRIRDDKIDRIGENFKENFLGFYHDEKLSWKTHVEEMRKSSNWSIYPQCYKFVLYKNL